MATVSSLLTQKTSVAGPAVGLGHCFLVEVDEAQDVVLQIVKRRKRAVACQLLSQSAEPDLDLIEPTAVLRRLDETKPMARIAQELAA